MEYPYFKGLEADRYSFYRVPKALVKADLFQKMSGDADSLRSFSCQSTFMPLLSSLHWRRKKQSRTTKSVICGKLQSRNALIKSAPCKNRTNSTRHRS